MAANAQDFLGVILGVFFIILGAWYIVIERVPVGVRGQGLWIGGRPAQIVAICYVISGTIGSIAMFMSWTTLIPVPRAFWLVFVGIAAAIFFIAHVGGTIMYLVDKKSRVK